MRERICYLREHNIKDCSKGKKFATSLSKFFPFRVVPYVIEKSIFPAGGNSCLLEKSPFQKGIQTDENHSLLVAVISV